MRPYLLVAGDFVKTGGMDRANYAVADFCKEGHEVHLVSHRVGSALLALPNIFFHRAPRLKSNVLGSVLIHREGKKLARSIANRGGCVIVNGGNCRWHDVNWVHYVHAAYPRYSDARGLERLKLRALHWRALLLRNANGPVQSIDNRRLGPNSERRRSAAQRAGRSGSYHLLRHRSRLFKPYSRATNGPRRPALGCLWKVATSLSSEV